MSCVSCVLCGHERADVSAFVSVTKAGDMFCVGWEEGRLGKKESCLGEVIMGRSCWVSGIKNGMSRCVGVMCRGSDENP